MQKYYRYSSTRVTRYIVHIVAIFEYAPFQLKEDDAKIIIMPMDDPNSLLHHALQTFDLVNIKKETIHQQH